MFEHMPFTPKEQRDLRSFCLRRVLALSNEYKVNYSNNELTDMIERCEPIAEAVVELLRIDIDHDLFNNNDYFTTAERIAFESLINRRCRAYATISVTHGLANQFERALSDSPLVVVLLALLETEAEAIDNDPFFADELHVALKDIPE